MFVTHVSLTILLIKSILQQILERVISCFFEISNSTKLSPIFKESLLFLTFMRAPTIAKNGLPKIIGTLEFSSISSTTKSVGMKNLLTWIGISSITPIGHFTERSTSYKEIVVGFKSPISSFFALDNDIKFTLAPRSQRAYLKFILLIKQDIEKLPRSFNL